MQPDLLDSCLSCGNPILPNESSPHYGTVHSWEECESIAAEEANAEMQWELDNER